MWHLYIYILPYISLTFKVTFCHRHRPAKVSPAASFNRFNVSCLKWSTRSPEYPDRKVHGANMGPTWALLAPDGPHFGPKYILTHFELIANHWHFNMDQSFKWFSKWFFNRQQSVWCPICQNLSFDILNVFTDCQSNATLYWWIVLVTLFK